MNEQAHQGTHNDDPARTEAPIGPAATAVAKRIEAERSRLADEEKLEVELASKRKLLLVAGNDAEVDDIERKIDASRSAQVRILERIELLKPEVATANAAHRDIELDQLAARANKAREVGEKLLREYTKHANPLATLLRKLYVADAIVERANLRLTRAGRAPVPNSNSMRCKGRKTTTTTEQRLVGLNEPEHPFFGKADLLQGNPDKAHVRGTSTIVATYVEVHVPTTRTEQGSFKEQLHQEIVLGTVDAEPGALWNKTIANAIDVESTARELGI